MNTATVTIRVELEAGVADKYLRELAALNARYGQTAKSIKSLILSDELAALGLANQLNSGLTKAGFDTVHKLRARTEAQLMELHGVVKWVNLRHIVRALARQGLVLEGCTTPIDELIELLPIDEWKYEGAKLAGVKTKDQYARWVLTGSK